MPDAVSTPVVPRTITPSVKNLTPNAIPPGISVSMLPDAVSKPFASAVGALNIKSAITADNTARIFFDFLFISASCLF
jgi:hypothetical protein